MYTIFFQNGKIYGAFPNKKTLLEWCYKRLDLTRQSSNERELKIVTWLSFNAEWSPDKFKIQEVFTQVQELRPFYVKRMSRKEYMAILARERGAVHE